MKSHTFFISHSHYNNERTNTGNPISKVKNCHGSLVNTWFEAFTGTICNEDLGQSVG